MKTDSQLQQDIIAELNWEPAVNASDIGVQVHDGIVTLTGHVPKFSEKLDAERAAQRVAGVKALTVELDVTLAGASHRTDTDIARAAENVFSWSTNVPDNSIKVMVEKGWITLTGHVRWDFERRGAAAAIRHLIGVNGVNNQIELKEPVAASSLKSDIEAALKRRAQRDANEINVTVQGTDVTLSGAAHSWNERNLATRTAWSTPGVWRVFNNITITP